MNKVLLLLLLLVLHLPAWGGQIVVGLRSDNVVSWSVWERKGSRLKHYLLLYNRGEQNVDLKIKLRRFAWVGTNFEDVPTNRTFFHVSLAAHQLVQLKYPKKLLEFDLLEYFENDQRIGLLLASTAKPDNTLFNDSSRFCTNEGVNAGNLGYWVALQSIHALPKRIVLTAARKFYPPSELLKQEYHLVKLFPNLYAQYPQPGVLDSLFTAGADASIVRLDAARPRAVVPARADLVTPGFSVFTICFEWVEDGYWYDEAKQLVPHKSIGGRIVFIPVFPAKTK